MKVLKYIITMTFASMICLASVSAIENEVASVGGVKYTTIQEAIDNANGQTVTILSDTTESVVIATGKNITLDLNGKTVTNVAGKHTVINHGNLTVKGDGTLDNVSHQKAALVNEEGGVANLISGTYTRSQEAGKNPRTPNGNSYYTIENFGTMVIGDSVKVYNNGHYSSMIHNGYYNGATQNPSKLYTPTLTINGGVFDGGINTVKNDDDGILKITGGSFTNTTQAAVLNWNKTTITGGEFTSDVDTVLNGKMSNTGRNAGELIITGGTFNAGSGQIIATMSGSEDLTAADVVVSGGTFNKEVNATYINFSEDEKEIVTNEDGTISIQYKKADYSKINELITKYNQMDKNKYTNESIQNVENAINKVDYNKTILQQNEVDEWASDIEKALNALVIKVENPNTSDMNIFAILSCLIVSGLVTVVAGKKLLTH